MRSSSILLRSVYRRPFIIPSWCKNGPIARGINTVQGPRNDRSQQWLKWLPIGATIVAVMASTKICLADAPVETPKALVVELKPHRIASKSDGMRRDFY